MLLPTVKNDVRFYFIYFILSNMPDIGKGLKFLNERENSLVLRNKMEKILRNWTAYTDYALQNCLLKMFQFLLTMTTVIISSMKCMHKIPVHSKSCENENDFSLCAACPQETLIFYDNKTTTPTGHKCIQSQ